MTDLIDIHVTTTYNSETVDLNDRTTYELVEWNAPGVTWRLDEIEGAYQPGSRLLNAVPDTATISGTVRVKGDTWVDQAAAADTLMKALGRFSYTLTEVIEGVTTTYSGCRPANVEPAVGIDARAVVRGRATYVITVRCDPRSMED